ncbi:MAG TPA: ATP-binding cassette domain-containing protein [Candidatus Acidoferrales bacterium]|nr:ATP-binding cassette domain-containing protein [Candidatus Acidoferrales bacterium]
MKAIEVRGLSKNFGDHAIFSKLSLHVGRGELVALLGPSGCGKTTILRCLAGLEKPDAGWFNVNGENGIVFQEPRLLGWLDVRGNVDFAARTSEEHSRVDELIELVGLSAAAKKLPKELSGGMAQRAALARSLVRKPEVLLLDEPFAAVDALRRYELQRQLRAIVEARGLSALIVTHDVDEAVFLADRILVLGGEPASIQAELPQGASREHLLAALASEDGRSPAIVARTTC